MGDDYVDVKIYPPTRDRLRRQKVGGETYDDVLNRLIEEAGQDHE